MDDMEVAQAMADIGEGALAFVNAAIDALGQADGPNALECLLTASWFAVKQDQGDNAHDWFARWLRSFADRVEQLGGKPH